jgi:hypothetical protein
VVLTIGLWVAEYANLTIRGLITKMSYLGDFSLWRLITCGLGAALCFGMAAIVNRMPARWAVRRVLLMSVLVFVSTAIWTLAAAEILRHTKANMSEPHYTLPELAVNYMFMLWVFGAWAACWIALQAAASLAERELQLARTSALVTEAQNKMLRYQINPHFMFNTLSALSTLILERRTQAADAIVVNLARFLRTSLERTPQDRIALSEELSIQQQYLDIEKVRFEDRLKVELAVDPSAQSCLVPSLILQPLVENAVKYGVTATDAPVTIRIEAAVSGGDLNIRVHDDGAPAKAPVNGAQVNGTKPAKLGVGLANIRDRLFLFYGERAELAAGPAPGGGYAATLRLPAERP